MSLSDVPISELAPKPTTRKPRAKKTRAPRTVSKRPFLIEKQISVNLEARQYEWQVMQPQNQLADTAACLNWIKEFGEPDTTYRVIQLCAEKTVRQKQMNVLE